MEKIVFDKVEAKALLAGTKSCFFLPINPPFAVAGTPGHLYTIKTEQPDTLFFDKTSQPCNPYETNDLIGIQEGWRALNAIPGTTRIEYEAGGIEVFPDVLAMPDTTGYVSAELLPEECIRHFLKITNISVKRVQEITVGDILDSGLNVELPPICKQELDPNWPSDEHKAKWAKMTDTQKDEYASNLARHRYIGWCKYADDLLFLFRKTWNSRIPSDRQITMGYNANPYIWQITFTKLTRKEVNPWP